MSLQSSLTVPRFAGGGLPTEPPAARALGGVVLGAAALGAGALAAELFRKPERRRERRSPDGAARGLHAAAALLSTSVLADSAIEHYRGSFENPGMFTPLVASLLSLVAGAEGATGARAPRRVRTGVYGLAAAVGAVGLGFHLYNLFRSPGGLSWQGLFYRAPLGAPAALMMAGAIGLSADEVQARPPGRRATVFGLPAGRALSALTSFGLAGTVGEVGLYHFRGSFQNPFMWLPVSLPPVAAILMGKAAAEPERRRAHRPLTRAWLAVTAILGVGGVGFHAYGVSRGMGGWKNWTQNLIDGPPLPAPPSFSALAIAALAALALRDREDGAAHRRS